MRRGLLCLAVVLLTAGGLGAEPSGNRAAKAEKAVYAHLVTWFKTRDFSDRWEMWGSDYPQMPSDPDKIYFNGKRDIATTSYPLTDVYDSSDPAAIEYQFLLMKLAGIDGVIVDWDGRRINRYRHDCLMEIVKYLDRFDMKLIVCFEEWCGYWPLETFSTRQEELAAAKEELQWMVETFLNQPFYGKVRGVKPVLVFRKINDKLFDKQEWRQLSSVVKDAGGALIFGEGDHHNFGPAVSGGKYFWVGGFTPGSNSSTLDYCREVYQRFLDNCRDDSALIFGSATPGFDDTPVWGWGNSPRVAPRYEGKRYEMTWEQAIAADVDAMQIVTWNDWNEGSQIEPDDENGYKYLEMTKTLVARYKGIADNIPDKVLQTPLMIYKHRKQGNPQEQARLDEIVKLLLTGQYNQALALSDTMVNE